MLCYRLIRSNRKTIQIQILPDKTIEVRAPKNVSDKRIGSFVTSKEKWINTKIEEKKEIAQIPVNHFYVVGVLASGEFNHYESGENRQF